MSDFWPCPFCQERLPSAEARDIHMETCTSAPAPVVTLLDRYAMAVMTGIIAADKWTTTEELLAASFQVARAAVKQSRKERR